MAWAIRLLSLVVYFVVLVAMALFAGNTTIRLSPLMLTIGQPVLFLLQLFIAWVLLAYVAYILGRNDEERDVIDLNNEVAKIGGEAQKNDTH
jgi:uncharacterized membrane protein (DUF485 family)